MTLLLRRPTAVALAWLLSAFCAAQASAQTAAPAAAPALPASPAGWSQAATADIQAAYQQTLDNHPGSVDPRNPAFLGNLQRARQEALSLAAQAKDSAGYVAAMQAFSVRIHDGHAGVATRLAPGLQPPERWPGFVSVWRGNGLFVYASESQGPPVGAEILACDGTPMRDIVQRNVFACQGRGEELGHWWVYARLAFVDRGNPFVTLPQRCQFRAGGQTMERLLTWTPSTEQTRQWLAQSYNGDELPVGTSQPKPGLFWVAMPSFQPNAQQRDAYRAMTSDVQDHRQRYLDAQAVVIDLRHNQGGSSLWSKQFAQALWGAGRVDRRLDATEAKTEVWWRSTTGNTAYVTGLKQQFTQNNEAESLAWVTPISAGMQTALAHGEAFFVEKDEPTATPAADPYADTASDPPAFTKPVYVVVPGQCASACLDALDVFTRFANTRLIGAPSAGDSPYMDVRTAPLPSGLGVVVIPNKVYVNRARGGGQIYTPAIAVTDVVWSTDNLLKAVEKDLAQRPTAR